MNEDLIKKLEDSPYVPTGESTARALIAAIPVVGGALDHLIFDKANTIKQKNIERSLAAINENVKNIGEEKIDKSWFESEEALSMFSELILKIQYEASESKIKALSKVYSFSGRIDLAHNPHKFAVLDKVAQMTDVQRKVLLILAETNPIRREFQSGGLKGTATAIWLDIAKDAVEKSKFGKFWDGIMPLDIELEILESLNLIRRITPTVGDTYGYLLTILGKSVINFLSTDGNIN
jgi:hypothetical protein